MIRALLLLWLLALPAQAWAQELVVTFGGDVNFARSRVPPSPDALRKFGDHDIEDSTRILAREFDGDINFVNVETVVSERDGSGPPGKTFVFRSHPENFRHLIALGVNAFSLANNHAYDHGWQGLADTLAFFRAETRPEHPLLFGGIGTGDEAFAPRIATIGGFRVAFAALGIGAIGYGPGHGRPGMALYSVPAQREAVLQGLKAARADLKILSVHSGTENQIALDWGQQAFVRRAVEEAGVHLVLGHHPHVVRAVEADPQAGVAVFYSLGNLLFAGGAVRDGLPVGQDYGLFGKAYFRMTPEGPRLSALEALPLVNVHQSPRPMDPARLRATLRHLGAISRETGPNAVAFTPLDETSDRGAACFGGPYGPAARRLCCRLSFSFECGLPDLM